MRCKKFLFPTLFLLFFGFCYPNSAKSTNAKAEPVTVLNYEFIGYIERFMYVKNSETTKDKILLVLQSLPTRTLHAFITLDFGLSFNELKFDYSDRSSTIGHRNLEDADFRGKMQKYSKEALNSIYFIGNTPGILSFVSLFPVAIHISVDWKTWEDPIDISSYLKEERIINLLIHPNNTNVVAILVPSKDIMQSDEKDVAKLYVRNSRISSNFMFVAHVNHHVFWTQSEYPTLIFHQIHSSKNATLSTFDVYSKVSKIVLSNVTVFRQIHGYFIAIVKENLSSNVSTFMVSRIGESFSKVHFPRFFNPVVLELFYYEAMDYLFLVVANNTFDLKHSRLFLYSAKNNRFGMKKILSDVKYLEGNCPSVQNHPILPGIMIAAIKHPNPDIGYTSVVTFNAGLTWSPMILSSGSCVPPSCIMRINHCDNERQWIVSANAPWLVVTVGEFLRSDTDGMSNAGLFLSNSTKMYISRDAGYSWNSVLPHLAHFTIIDHGGVIILAPSYTQIILYSIDEGRKWKELTFTHEPLLSLSFMDISEDFSSRYAMLVTKTNSLGKPSVILYRFDFSNLFSSLCSEHANFYKWSPLLHELEQTNHFTPCFRGQKYTFLRRKKDVSCFIPSHDEPHSENFVNAAMRKSSCECVNSDFECLFGYEYYNKSCVPDPDFSCYTDCISGTFHKSNHSSYVLNNGQCSAVLSHPDSENASFSIKDQVKIPSYKNTEICHLDLHSNGIGYLTNNSNGFMFIGLRWNADDKSLSFDDMTFSIPGLSSMHHYTFDLLRGCIYAARNQSVFTFCYSKSDPFYIMSEIPWKRISFENEESEIVALEYDSYGDNLLVATKTKISVIRLITGFSYKLWEATDIEIKQVKFYSLDGIFICQYKDLNFHGYTLEVITFGGLSIAKLSNLSLTFSSLQFDPHSFSIYFYNTTQNTSNQFIVSVDLRFLYHQSDSILFNSTSILHCIDQSMACHQFTLSRRKSKEEKLYLFVPTEDSVVMYELSQNSSLTAVKKSSFDVVFQKGFTTNSTSQPLIFDSRDFMTESPCLMNRKCKNFCFRNYLSSDPAVSHFCYCEDLVFNSSINSSFISDRCSKLSKVCDRKSQFECRISKECISKHQVCNQRSDCFDASDESSCTNNHWKITCKPGQRKCLKENSCVDEDYWCDGKYDCMDGSDETSCSGKTKSCPVNTFDCLDGTCIATMKVCDRKKDCDTHLDEMFCDHHHITRCDMGEFRCSDGKCISSEKLCDGFDDCSSGEDEYHCNKESECLMRCYSGICITSAQFCNGVNDCEFGEDEVSCPFDDFLHNIKARILFILLIFIPICLLLYHKRIRRMFAWFILRFRIKRFYGYAPYDDFINADSDLDPLINGHSPQSAREPEDGICDHKQYQKSTENSEVLV